MDADDIEDILANLSEEETPPTCETGGQPPRPLLSTLDSQIKAKLGAVNEIYRQRSPLFEQLALSAHEYIKLVEILGNASSVGREIETRLNDELGTANTVKLCIMFAQGPVAELEPKVYQDLLALVHDLSTLLTERSSRKAAFIVDAEKLSPNLLALIEANTLAELLLKVGSIELLAETPPSNLINPASSPLATDKLILEVPEAQKRQALRILSGKVILAARLDTQGPSLNPITSQWRRNVELRIGKLLAPPPSLNERALPKPITKRRPRRGGQRARAQKRRQKPFLEPEFVKFGK